jgi:prepilin-type N-terminal cleavage/methylation domain-containing protein
VSSIFNSKASPKASARRSAYTLVEMLMVMTLIAVLAGLLIPSVTGVRDSLDERKAIGQKALIGAAKAIYLKETGDAGLLAWSAAGGDAARFLLIRPYLGPGASAATLSTYFPSGYAVALNGLGADVVLYQNGVPLL